MVKVIANGKVLVCSLTSTDTSLAGILSSPVDILPSKDLNSCAASLLSMS